MYNIALVQNQSEMSHYGYADARPLLDEFGYQFKLYTARNIGELSNALCRGRFDAVVFASNALNDKTIRDTIASDEFKRDFSNFLRSGKGCLVLHQLRLAQTNSALSFLPNPLDIVKPQVRDADETASDGNLFHTDITMTNVCFLYPNKIEISRLKSHCLSFRSLKGLYWHYFENINRSDWDLLLFDTDKRGLERPLVVASKESDPFRVVLCALTLDWQKQKRFLQNILTYVVEGKHNTAVIRDSKNISAAFNYLIDCLRSDKYPFRIYDVDLNLSDFLENVKSGVHSIIIMDPFVDRKIGKDAHSLIEQYVKDGKLKLIGIDSNLELGKFHVAGRERYALRLLHDSEIKIQKELHDTGYIDGSFWSTVESLQILNEIPQVRSKFDQQTLKNTFKNANTHDRNGSYDEVFGVTCALLWLRAKYLGRTHSDTERTLSWVRRNLSDFEDREKALAYFTLIGVELATKEDKENLRNILLSQNVDRLSEIDLIVYLKAAIAVGAKDALIPIVNCLKDKQDGGCWIDLATSATAVIALLDVLKLLREKDTAPFAEIRPRLESMISEAIIYIQDSRENVSVEKSIDYPWDNKASTSLKCIQALLKFEELVDLPVHEIIDAVLSYSGIETSKSSAKTALAILEELKKENRKLYQDNRLLSGKALEYKKSLTTNKILWISFIATFYLLASLLIYSLRVGTSTPMQEILEGAFIEAWPFHIAFIGLAATVYKLLPFLRRHQEGESTRRE